MGSSRPIRSLQVPDIRVPGPVVVVPTLLVVASELLLFFGYVGASLWVHTVTLVACTLAPVYVEDEASLFRAFALVPLFRLVNLGMPVFFQLTVFWFPLIYGPLIPVLVSLVRRGQRRWSSLDRARTLAVAPAALALSVLLAEVEYAIIRPEPLIPQFTAAQLVMLSVVMFGFVGLTEELLFRGVFQRTLQDRIGRRGGLVLASGIFALMHSGYSVPAELAFAGLVGLAFGVIYDLTDSIGLVAATHGLLNVFLFGVIPHRGSVVAGLIPG